MSSHLDHHLQPATQNLNSFIKNTNYFLKKIKSLGQVLEVVVLFTLNGFFINKKSSVTATRY